MKSLITNVTPALKPLWLFDQRFMKSIIIVARSKQGVIGRDNELPWYLPPDLKHFKNTTLGHPIIMGRNTWESLGRALPGRRNIVVSRSRGFSPEGAECFSSLEDAIAACQSEPQTFIIGGAQVYEQALSFVDEMIITEVDLDVVGDAHFPNFSAMDWKEIHRDSFPAILHESNPDKNQPAYAFVHYLRK